jgi:receptor expression-enhancing protein 5/6
LNCRIPIWYDVKLLFVAWLVLPQFQGAAFLYERFVREQIKKYRGTVRDDHHDHHKSPNGNKGKTKFMHFIVPKKVGDSFTI